MNNLRAFDLAFVGLKPGEHVFEFFITDAFFESYPPQDFSNCNINVHLTLEKKNGLLFLKFGISGNIHVICDRCGNTLPLNLWDEFNIVVKLVEDPEMMNAQEDDPDMYYIAQGESYLHVATWIYEFINLSIPLQKHCTKNQQGGAYCNKEVLTMLEKMRTNINK